jgi:tight adherence protein B
VRRALLLAVAVALACPVLASASDGVAIRRVDLARFPNVRVTVVAPVGTRPVLLEAGRRAAYASTRELGSAEALMLAVDNSESMRGEPLREAKRAAADFLAQERRAGSLGLVAFGHEALALTRAGESKADVTRTLMSLRPDTQTGTSLYDAVVSSVPRLQRMSTSTRILVLLTDGRDVGSRASLERAVGAAERANVVVYAIAVGKRVDREPLARLTGATGGRVFGAADVTDLSAAYGAIHSELDRSWQISFLAIARPGDRMKLQVRASGAVSATSVRIPSSRDRTNGPLPASIAGKPLAGAVVVLLAALLLAAAGVVVMRRRQKSDVRRLLQVHLERLDQREVQGDREQRFEPLLAWTEKSIAELPGAERLTRIVESSGLKLRIGHVPYIGGFAGLFLAVVGTVMGAGPMLAVLLMVVGCVLPLPLLHVAARRRRQAFDRQLPDVLATVASTLRAGHGLRAALRGVADDGSPPASHEFTRVLGEERLGQPLDRAMASMCERIGSPDLEYVATAINVQSQAGGSLATLFDTLSETVRERQRHARKVRALTSMGRMSATILVSLPFGLVALMTLISPKYMSPFFTTSTGHVLIGFCLASMTIGALILKRIVNVRY